MAWKIKFSKLAEKQFGKLSQPVQKRVYTYLKDRILSAVHPQMHGKALVGPYAGAWRYRVGDYRIICELDKANEIITVHSVAHRGKVYTK